MKPNQHDPAGIIHEEFPGVSPRPKYGASNNSFADRSAIPETATSGMSRESKLRRLRGGQFFAGALITLALMQMQGGLFSPDSASAEANLAPEIAALLNHPPGGPILLERRGGMDRLRLPPINQRNYDLVLPNPAKDAIEGNKDQLEEEGIIFNGFNIEYNQAAIQERLKPNEAVAISIVDPRPGHKNKILVKQIVIPQNAYEGVNSPALRQSEYYVSGLGDLFYDYGADIQPLGGGMEPYPIRVVLQKYRFKEIKRPAWELEAEIHSNEPLVSPKPHLVETVSASLQLASNLECEGVNNEITTDNKIPEQIKLKICRYIAEVVGENGIVPKDYRFILDTVNTSDDFNPHMDDKQRIIVINLPLDKDRGSHSTAFGAILHEATHSTYLNLPKSHPIRTQIDHAYNLIKKGLRHPMPTSKDAKYNYDGAVTEPAWAALTEATYEQIVLGFPNSPDGHPWDNPTEMASSTLDILATYPDTFIKVFDRLPDKQKPAVTSTVVASLSLIKHAGGEQLLINLIPSYIKIINHLGIDSNSLRG